MSKVDRKEVRQGRVPIASNRAPLVVTGFDNKNFQGRWVADTENRLETFLAAGYEFVEQKQIKKAGEDTVNSSSGIDGRIKKPGGRGVMLYLMRLPMELYLEDQAAKAKEIDATEESMRRPGKGSVISGEVDYGNISIGSRMGGVQGQIERE